MGKHIESEKPKLRQVEFILEGNLLPTTIMDDRVTNIFLLEQTFGGQLLSSQLGDQKSYARAYIATDDDPNPFPRLSFAVGYLEFFLLIHALTTGEPVTHRIGVSSVIPSLDFLGRKYFTFPAFEKIRPEDSNMRNDLNSVLSKPFLATKSKFLELIENRQRIMEGYLGLCLRYYYFATQAFQNGRYEMVVLNLATVAEALVSTGNFYGSNLERRIPRLIAEDLKERKRIAEILGKFYRLRSLIVHGERVKISRNDFREARIYVKTAVEKAMSLGYFSKHELIGWLDGKAKP